MAESVQERRALQLLEEAEGLAPGCVRCRGGLESAPVASIPLCGSCLAEAAPPRRVLGLLPPWPAMRQRIKALVPAGATMGLGALGGWAWAVHAHPNNHDQAFVSAVLGLVLGEIVGLAAVFSRVHHVGRAEWRREVLERLGLHAPPPGLLTFGAYLTDRPRWTNFTLAIDAGVMAEGAGGLAFLGTRGTRASLALEEIAAVSVERLWMSPPRAAVRLDLRAGGSRFLVPMERATFRENRAEAERIAARLSARLTQLRLTGQGAP